MWERPGRRRGKSHPPVSERARRPEEPLGPADKRRLVMFFEKPRRVSRERRSGTGAGRGESGPQRQAPSRPHSFPGGTRAALSPGIWRFIPPEVDFQAPAQRTNDSFKAREEPGLKWTNVLQFLDS